MAISVLDIISGLVISAYFLIFLPILFYSSLNYLIEGKYNDSFSARFPVLYACVFVIAGFISMQKEYFKVNVIFKQRKKLRFVRLENIFTIFKNICQRELFLCYNIYPFGA